MYPFLPKRSNICVFLFDKLYGFGWFRYGPFPTWAWQTHLLQKKKASERQGLSQACPSRSAKDLGLRSDLVTMIGHWFFSCELAGGSALLSLFLLFQWPEIGVLVLLFGAHKFVISEHHPISFQVFSIMAHGTSGLFKRSVFSLKPWNLRLRSHLQDMYIRRVHCRKGFLFQFPRIWKEAGNWKSMQPDHPVAQDLISFVQVAQ